ncbi:Cytochrome P450 71D10, partial [Mucuna pruriens]
MVMELHNHNPFPVYFITSFLFLFLLVLLKLLKTFGSSKSSTKLPPGPWTLPVIGNIHQVVGSLPHQCFKKLADKYGPLMHLKLGEVSNIIVTSPQMAQEIISTRYLNFCDRPNLFLSAIVSYNNTNIVFAQHGEYWRQLRKICTSELLSPKRVQSFRSIRKDEVSELVKKIYASAREGSIFNLSQNIYPMTYGIAARASFGKKCRYQQVFTSKIEEQLKLLGGFSLADLYPSIRVFQMLAKGKVEKVHREIDRVLEDIIDEHKNRKSGECETVEDLVDVLLMVQSENELEFPLTDDNIKAVIQDMLTAGGETSSATIEWGMSEMIRNPRVMEAAQAEVRKVFDSKGYVDESELNELVYLKSIIKETLRLHPPVPLLIPRVSREKCQINGYEIPAKTTVIINIWAIGRSLKYWTEAESFKPERFLNSSIDFKGTNFEFIPFGAGRRICPGIGFAMPNIELSLAHLLYHFDWKLPNKMKNEELDMADSYGITLRRENDLCLIPVPSSIHPFLFAPSLICYHVQRSGSNKSSTKLPPGPRTLPLIGNLHQLVGSQTHHCLKKMADKYGPLMHLKLGEVSNIIVTSPQMTKEIMKTNDLNFADRPYLQSSRIVSYNGTNISFSPHGDYWRQLRKICTVELLTAKRVQSFRCIREDEVSELVEKICASASEGSIFNLSQNIYPMTYGIAARAAFGKKCRYQQVFISKIEEQLKLIEGFSVADLYPSSRVLQMMAKGKLEKVHGEIDRMLQDIIDEHKNRKRGECEAVEDLVDVLLKFQSENELGYSLTDDNIKAVIQDMFIGGGETSSAAVEWGMSEMIRNPRVMEVAQAEVRRVFDSKGNVDKSELHQLVYLKSIIKETLRLHPSVPLLIPRVNREKCQINGYEIPAKSRVIINAWAIGRNPKYWAEAESFKPERFQNSSIDFKGTDFEFIPFGTGRRICPGITFAIPNIELPLAQLLYHFDWKLPNKMKNEKLDMTEGYGITLRRENDLCLIPITRRT